MTAAAILVAVPHDGAALFVYVLIGFCVVLVWRASRRPGAAPAADRTPRETPFDTPSRTRP